jgi:hypothetical protein
MADAPDRADDAPLSTAEPSELRKFIAALGEDVL